MPSRHRPRFYRRLRLPTSLIMGTALLRGDHMRAIVLVRAPGAVERSAASVLASRGVIASSIGVAGSGVWRWSLLRS